MKVFWTVDNWQFQCDSLSSGQFSTVFWRHIPNALKNGVKEKYFNGFRVEWIGPNLEFFFEQKWIARVHNNHQIRFLYDFFSSNKMPRYQTMFIIIIYYIIFMILLYYNYFYYLKLGEDYTSTTFYLPRSCETNASLDSPIMHLNIPYISIHNLIDPMDELFKKHLMD